MVNEFGFDISQFYPGLIDSVGIKRRKRHREETPVENQNQKETLDLDHIHQCVSPPSELNNAEVISQPVRENFNNRKKKKFRRRNQILNNLDMDKICHQCGKINPKLEYFGCENKNCGNFYCNRCMKKYEEGRKGIQFGNCFSCRKQCKCINCKSLKNLPNKNIVSIDLENLDQKKNLVQIDDYLIVENEAPDDEAELYSKIEEISEIEEEKFEASYESPQIKNNDIPPKIESPHSEFEREEEENTNIIINSVENLKNNKLLPCIVCSQICQDINSKTLTFKSLKMFVSYLQHFFNQNPPDIYPEYQKVYTEFNEYYQNYFLRYYKSDYVFKSVKNICRSCFESQLKEERGFDNLFNYLHISNNVLNAGKKEKKEKFKQVLPDKKFSIVENSKTDNNMMNSNMSNNLNMSNNNNSNNNNSASKNLPNTPNLSKLLEFLKNSNLGKNNEKSNNNLLNLLSQVNSNNSINNNSQNTQNNNFPSGNHSEVKSEILPQEEESVHTNNIPGNIQTTFHQQTINQPINQSFNLNINNSENESRQTNLNNYMNNVLEELRKQFFCIQYYSLIQKFFISYIFRHLDTFIEQITRNQSLGEFVMNSMVSHIPKILGCFENNSSEVQSIINNLNEQMSLLKNINTYGVNLTLSLNSNFEGLKNNGMKIFKAMDPSLNACLNNNLNNLMMSAKDADTEKNSFEAIMNSLGGLNKEMNSNFINSIVNNNNNPASTSNPEAQQQEPQNEHQGYNNSNNNSGNSNKFNSDISSHNLINNSGGLLNMLASINKSIVSKPNNSVPQGLSGLLNQTLNFQGLENLMSGNASSIAGALNGLNLASMPSLPNLSALTNLGSITGINPLAALSGLSNMPSLNSISGFPPFNNLGLGRMSALTGISGMQALSALNGLNGINSLPGMPPLNGLNSSGGLNGLNFLNSLNNLSNSQSGNPSQQNLFGGNFPGSSLPSLENMLHSILNAERNYKLT
jgi:hypothetical protein